MQFSREQLQRIRERADLLDLIGGYTRLERRGSRWWGLSPFKTERTPSFTVQPDKGFYHCFATGKGGDVFSFVMELERLDFAEAVRFLAQRAGVELDQGPPDEADRTRAALAELYERVSHSFAYLLAHAPEAESARSYTRRRGIAADSIERFRLGYAPDSGTWLHRFLRSKSYSPEFLAQSGLFSTRYAGYALFRNRLIFPIVNRSDQAVAFGGRALGSDDTAKYVNSPETVLFHKSRLVYGLAQSIASMRQTRRVHLVEGYTDVIAMHQVGVTDTVAPLGTAFTAEQATLLKRYCDEVVLLFDGDSAGVAASFRAAAICERAELKVAAVALPAGSDPADLAADRDGGAAKLTDAIARAEPAFTALIRLARAEVAQSDSTDAREMVLHRVLPYITVIASEVRRESLLDRLASELGVSRAAVRSDYERFQRGERRNVRGGTTTPAESSPGKVSSDLKLVLGLAQRTELYTHARGRLGPEMLDDAEARRIAALMEDAFRHDDELPQGLVDRIEDIALRELVLQRLTSGEFEAVSYAGIDQALDGIELRMLRRELSKIDASIARADEHDIHGLQERKMAIHNDIAALRGTSG